MKLTGRQLAMLQEAEAAPGKGWDGVTARGGRSRTAYSLTERELLRFVGVGQDETSTDDSEVNIFEITDAGRAALAAGAGK